MYQLNNDKLQRAVVDNVRAALSEDIETSDISAELLAEDQIANARVITRQAAVICGQAWVDEVFRQLDPRVRVDWQVKDGDCVSENQVLFTLRGPIRALLSGERSALNFLQTLSAIATRAKRFHDQVVGTHVQLLDTRKTIPGLRVASKYAVRCGGCQNHRIDLSQAFLLKENHIAAAGNISLAVKAARELAPNKPIQVEVETIAELKEALEAGAQLIMLDNFSVNEMREAVGIANGKACLEASGGITEANLRQIAETGIDYISLGTLTKDVTAIDLSMRLVD